jgi:hypothetical protein
MTKTFFTGFLMKANFLSVKSTCKILFAVLIFAASFATSCKDNGDDDEVTTVEEDKVNIQASFDRISAMFDNARNSSLFNLVFAEKEYYWYNYVGEGNGSYIYEYGKHIHAGAGKGDYAQIPEKEWGTSNFIDFTGDILEKLDEKFNLGKNLGEGFERDRRFNFTTLNGKYIYNNSTKNWDKSQSSSFIAVFPDAENSSNNNCELALTDYNDKSCNIEGKVTYLPTKIKAYFKKDNTQMIDIDATADYTQQGIPTSANVKLYAKPFNIETGLKQEAASRYSANISIKDETAEVNNLSIACTISLSKNIDNSKDLSDIFDNGDGVVNSLSFTINQEKLTLSGTADIRTLSKISRPSVVEINNSINIKVQYNKKEIGELKIHEVEGEKYAYIYYKDGTSENTEIYYEKLINHLEELFSVE